MLTCWFQPVLAWINLCLPRVNVFHAESLLKIDAVPVKTDTFRRILATSGHDKRKLGLQSIALQLYLAQKHALAQKATQSVIFWQFQCVACSTELAPLFSWAHQSHLDDVECQIMHIRALNGRFPMAGTQQSIFWASSAIINLVTGFIWYPMPKAPHGTIYLSVQALLGLSTENQDFDNLPL